MAPSSCRAQTCPEVTSAPHGQMQLSANARGIDSRKGSELACHLPSYMLTLLINPSQHHVPIYQVQVPFGSGTIVCALGIADTPAGCHLERSLPDSRHLVTRMFMTSGAMALSARVHLSRLRRDCIWMYPRSFQWYLTSMLACQPAALPRDAMASLMADRQYCVAWIQHCSVLPATQATSKCSSTTGKGSWNWSTRAEPEY